MEKRLTGIPVSAGQAHGRLCIISIQEPEDFVLNSLPRAYSTRLNSALQSTNTELINLVGQCSSLGQDMFEAVYTHNLIMSDQNLQKWIGFNVLEQSDDLEAAINSYLESYRNLLLNCLEHNLEEQSRLFRNLKQSLSRLVGNHHSNTYCRDTMGCDLGECVKKNRHIMLCKDLSPISAIMLDELTCGVLVENEAVNIDASILLRGLKIPVISGMSRHANEMSHQNDVLIDGAEGLVIINPEQQTLDSLLAAH